MNLIFDSIPLMILDMCRWKAAHPDIDIIPSDDPVRLEIGYTSTSDDYPRNWCVRLDAIRNSCWKDMNVQSRCTLTGQLLDPDFIDRLHKHVDSCERCLPPYVLNM